jgi:hypothetical protein
MSYSRFGAMIVTSTAVMFGLMYLNTYSADYAFWSETRAYMALYMGAVMAIIMLSYMLSMYGNKAANMAIYFGGHCGLRHIGLSRPQPSQHRRCRLHEGDDYEGDDSGSFNCYPDQRKSQHF